MPSAEVAPGRVPVLGHLVPLRRRPLDFLQALRSQGDVVTIYLGPMRVLVVNSPELIRQVLVSDRKKFDKGVLFDKARQVLGGGIATSSGAFHLRQRRLMQPAFHHERLATYADRMAELASRRVAAWRPGQELALDRELHELTLDVVANTLFSSDLGRAATAEVQRSLPTVMRGFTRRTLSPTRALERIPTPSNRRFDAARSGLLRVIDDVVREYRTDGADRDDLLSMLVRARDEDGAPMTDEQLRDELVTILVAGTDTTAITLSWLYHELGRHPQAERRLHDELDRVLDARPAGYADLADLRYAERALTEVLRLHTPAWMLMRRTVAPVDLGGMRLPVGAELMLSPTALHRDPLLYPDPSRFEPDRWAGEASMKLPRGAFIPFGAGDRRCIGDAFAMTEMKIVVASISGRFRLRPIPGLAVREVAAGLLHPSAVRVVAKPWPS